MAADEIAADAIGEPQEGPAGPPAGFGREVHDYLGHYVSVADAKAGAVVAGGIAVVAASASITSIWNCDLASLGAGVVVASMLLAAYSLFPRQPSGGGSVIFWMDIQARGDAQGYQDALSAMDEQAVQREYARQNFVVSGVVRKKFQLVQGAIGLWMLGVILLAAAAWSLRG